MRALRGAVVLLVLAACSRERPLEGPLGRPVSWTDDVAPLFAANCTSCHAGAAAAAAAGYRTTSYLEAIGPRDKPIAVAGDPASVLLTTLDPAHADAVHAKVSSAFATARAWVVDGRLALSRDGVHEAGILNPDDPQFHGKVLRNNNWNFGICQKCHGSDFSGGTAGVSCLQCHTEPAGPTSCDTCHGQPPVSGQHLTHVSGLLGRKLDCSECHVKPARFDDPGHLTTADGKAKDKATVTLGAQAALPGPGRAGPPGYDGATCSNIYCHGGAFKDTNAPKPQPVWTNATPGTVSTSCGTCHGLPPSSHDAASTNCSECHFQVTPPGNKPMVTALHVDGIVQVGDGSNTCSACHGTAQSSAPPRDLSGNTSPSAVGVGAHQAHLFGAQNLSGTIACSACHKVPATLHEPGHFDHPLPATVVFSDLALADGAMPAWDHASATCSATYCHGGGAKMAGDTAFKLRKPVWTLGGSQAFCGSCHGLPPGDAQHAGIQYPDCARCHATTVTPAGGIIVSGPPGARTSTHINGVIDVTP